MNDAPKLKQSLFAALFAGAVLFTAPARASQFYATQVIAASAGSAQSDSFSDPTLALGGPTGGGTTQGSIDTYNLGVSGTLTLGFDDGNQTRVIDDLPGPDFTVFENPFYRGGNTAQSFAELIFIEVSSNGVDYVRFPVVSNTSAAVSAFGTINPANVNGFAGVHPVLANVDTNTINPFDPTVSGGDAFDLSALANDPLVLSGSVNLSAIRFVRFHDVPGDGSLMDGNGHPIFDPTGLGNNGADVDAVAVINGANAGLPHVTFIPEPTGLVLVGGAGLAYCAIRGRVRRAGNDVG